MSHKKSFIIISIILFAVCLSFIVMLKIPTKNDFSPKVLVIHKQDNKNYLDIYQNYKQSYVLNTEVQSVDDLVFKDINLAQYTLIYPDVSLINSSHLEDIKESLISYVNLGGNLVLENDWLNVFPKEITGVEGINTLDIKNPTFKYNKVSYNLEPFQSVLKDFLNNLIEYKSGDIAFDKMSIMKISSSSQSIGDVNDGSIMAVNKYGNGHILICSNLFPNKDFITGFDLTKKSQNQEYFDYSLATMNYYLRNEFLSFVLKERYGFVLTKVFGPYGRPSMAWQNHYEALSSIKDKELISWIDILKDYNEIPSASLVRSTFDWGKWESTIALHLNIGTNNQPMFLGEYEDSYYSSGKHLTTENDYLTFGTYPEYKSLKDQITLPDGAHPAVVDFDYDGDNDLIVGTASGHIYLVKNVGTKTTPAFKTVEKILLEDDSPLRVANYAAPFIYDINGDKFFDIVVGDGNGNVTIFENKVPSNSTCFLEGYKLSNINVGGNSTPAFGDIDSDKVDELLIGNSQGSIKIYEKQNDDYILKNELMNSALEKYTSPFVFDYNSDGKNDILVGDNSGTIKVLLNNKSNFVFTHAVEGQTTNMYGSKALLGGHNSAPIITDWNNDGVFDLLVGQLEFGIPYDIDGKYFKHEDALREILDYTKSHGISIYPHFYTHKYKSKEQELEELALHKKAFEYYNLGWSGGVDQHTWQTNEDSSLQTLHAEIESNIWWNFGFNPSNEPDLPRDGNEYLFSTPFLLGNGEQNYNFVCFTPSPNIFNYSNAYKTFSKYDMPITYFEHIEYSLKDNKKLDKLKEMAEFLNTLRDEAEYNFMTQGQMAKCFINTFYSNAVVSIKDNKISIKPDTSKVPKLAGEYKGTLGLKLELGEKYKDNFINTSSEISYQDGIKTYFGLHKTVNIDFSDVKVIQSNPQIIRANVPILVINALGNTHIRFLSEGMQQIKIYSPKDISITGERIKVDKKDNYYTITHYGYPITVSIKK